MNLRLKKIVVTFSLIFFCIVQAYANKSSKILIINSYHNTLSWTDSLNRGFIDVLKKNKLQYEIFLENLDLKRNTANTYLSEFTTYLKAKYGSIGIDLIAVTDNDALNFVETVQADFFQQVPVIFCGINNRYTFPKNFTGVIEEVDIPKNIDLIAKLHPNISKLYCVVDQTTTGKILEKSIIENITTSTYSFDIRIIKNLPINTLIDSISILNGNAAILFVLYNQDSQGKYLTYEAALDSINKYAKVPIYGTWGFYLQHGIVGGHIISGLDHGRLAGEMAIKILSGTPVEKIKPIQGPTKYVFDYKAMHKHKISLIEIPKNSTVLSNPYDFIQKNKRVLIFTLLLFLILLVIIYLLTVINRHRTKLIRIQKSHNLKLKEKNAQINESLKKAEEANVLKSAFLANMSHEIRTPMNAILGFSKIIQIREDLQRDEVLNFVNIIVDNSEKLLNLINDIVDISKIEANQLKMNIQRSNINSILKDCISIAEIEKDRLSKNDIELILITEPVYCDILADTDPDRIRQVIMNLLNNALKFTEAGAITVGCSIHDEWIEIFVQDTGIGIDNANKEIIFDRFRQVDSSHTRKYGGSGLGLSICKGIIKNLGGEIGVISETGAGSKFWFRIPNNVNIEMPSEPNSGKTIIATGNLENKTILIVEDNYASRKLLFETLKHTKAELLIANSAEEAIEICKSNSKINIVLMDIQLPGISGYDAVKILKELRPNLPIIAQTANAMSDEKEKAIMIGCNDYIAKPYDMEYLFKSLERLTN